MTASSIILIDVDDTLGNLKERLQNIYRTAVGDNTISYESWTDHNSSNRYSIDWPQLQKYLIEDESISRMEPHWEVSEVTQQLRRLGYYLVIVTARGWHPTAHEDTANWLRAHNIAYDEIIIVGLTESKVEATNHLGHIHMFIDDRLDYCREFVNSGRVNYSMNYAQPWNVHSESDKNNSKLRRIDDMREVLMFA